jgi:diaminopimelate decarboxylase
MTPIWQRVEELEERDGVLFFDGCSAVELARRFGTPLYVYSENRLRKNYRRLHDALRGQHEPYEIYYALKVNGNPAVVEVLRTEGAGADCATLQEVAIALQAGVPRERILFTGAYISREELAQAVELGIQVNLAETCHLEAIAGVGPPALLSFRVNPGRSMAPSDCEFNLGDGKFGISPEEAVAAYGRARQLGVRRFGIHAMAGSNVLEVEYFERLLAFACEMALEIKARAGVELEFVNLGGALGVPYRESQRGLDVAAMGSRLGAILKKMMPGARLRLIQEPGRYLAADAGILLSRVTSIKRGASTFVGIDAGMNTLARPAMYGAYHHILYAADLRLPADRPAHVVGQICEARDVVARDRPLPAAVAVGDVLALLDAGAYGYAMSSRFHAKLPAAEVLARDGAAELIRTRPELGEVLAGTRRPSWLPAEGAGRVGQSAA